MLFPLPAATFCTASAPWAPPAGALAWPLATHAQPTPVLTGQSLPLSGPMAGVFAAVLAGEKLAIDESNQRLGGRGQPIELALMDDGYDPKRTA